MRNLPLRWPLLGLGLLLACLAPAANAALNRKSPNPSLQKIDPRPVQRKLQLLMARDSRRQQTASQLLQDAQARWQHDRSRGTPGATLTADQNRVKADQRHLHAIEQALSQEQSLEQQLLSLVNWYSLSSAWSTKLKQGGQSSNDQALIEKISMAVESLSKSNG